MGTILATIIINTTNLHSQHNELLNGGVVCGDFSFISDLKLSSAQIVVEHENEVGGPTLRSSATFYIELEQFRCSFSVGFTCTWNN